MGMQQKKGIEKVPPLLGQEKGFWQVSKVTVGGKSTLRLEKQEYGCRPSGDVAVLPTRCAALGLLWLELT